MIYQLVSRPLGSEVRAKVIINEPILAKTCDSGITDLYCELDLSNLYKTDMIVSAFYNLIIESEDIVTCVVHKLTKEQSEELKEKNYVLKLLNNYPFHDIIDYKTAVNSLVQLDITSVLNDNKECERISFYIRLSSNKSFCVKDVGQSDDYHITGSYYNQNRRFDSNQYIKRDLGRLGTEYFSNVLDKYAIKLPIAATSSQIMPINYMIMMSDTLNTYVPILDSYTLYHRTKPSGFYIYHLNGYSDFDYISHELFEHYFGITADEAYYDMFNTTTSPYEINIYADLVSKCYTILEYNQHQLLMQDVIVSSTRNIIIKSMDGMTVNIEILGHEMHIEGIAIKRNDNEMEFESTYEMLIDNNGNRVVRSFSNIDGLPYISEVDFITEKLKLTIDASHSNDDIEEHTFRVRLYRINDNGEIVPNALFLDNTYYYENLKLKSLRDNIGCIEREYRYHTNQSQTDGEYIQYRIQNRLLDNPTVTELYRLYKEKKYLTYGIQAGIMNYIYFDSGYDIICTKNDTGLYNTYQAYYTINGEASYIRQSAQTLDKNVLVNGDFSSGDSSWETDRNKMIESNDYMSDIIGANVYTSMPEQSNTFSERYVKQTVNVDGLNGDEWCFSLWGKGIFSSSGYFRVKIQLKSGTYVIDEFIYSFNNMYSSFQPLYGEFTASGVYTSIDFLIEYKGIMNYSIGNVRMYKKARSRLPIFDDNMLISYRVKNEEISKYDYDEYNRQILTSDFYGNCTVFSYNDNDQIVSKIDGLTGSKMEYEYNDRGFLISEKYTTKNAGYISSTYEVNDFGDVLTITDGEDKKVFNAYDSNHRLIESTSYNGITNQYSYTDYDAVLKRHTHLNNKEDGVIYEYDDLQRLKSLTDKAGSKFEYTYDENGIVTKVKINGNLLNEITYNEKTNKVTKIQYGSDEIPNSFKYSYDNKYNLSEITYNDNSFPEFEFSYDNDNILKSVSTIDTVRNYNYDSSGNIVSEKLSKNNVVQNEILYSYNKHNRLEATNYLFNDYNRMYLYEYKDADIELTSVGYLNKMATRLQGDCVLCYRGPQTLYSKSLISSNYETQSLDYLGCNLIKLKNGISHLTYSLNNLNSDRVDKNSYNGTTYNSDLWNQQYNGFKTIILWARFDNFDNARSIAKFYKDGQFKYGLLITADKKIGFYQDDYYLLNNPHIDENSELSQNWNYIRIYISNNSIGVSVNMNEKYCTTLYSNPIDIDTVKFSYENGTSQATDYSSFALAYIGFNSISSTDYTEKMIYMRGIEYLSGNNSKRINRVTYYDEEMYREYELIPLTGSLVSLNGLKPFKYGRHDLYRYDLIHNKPVYNSNIVFGVSEYDYRELAYRTSLPKNGTIIIWAKPEPTIGSRSRRYLFGCDNEVSKFFVYLDETHKLYVEHNDRIYTHDICLKQNEWNMIACVCDDVNMKIKINDMQFRVYAPYTINLTNTSLYIGSIPFIYADDTSLGLTDHEFDPYGVSIQNVAFKSSVASFDELHEIYNTMGYIDVSNEYDENNRIRSKNITLGNKQYNKIYRYYNTTSEFEIFPSSEVDHTGEEIIYTKDEDDNITRKVTVTSDGKLISIEEYVYDEMKMLKEELKYFQDSFSYKYQYEYDSIGNITLRQSLDESDNILYKDLYIYSSSHKSLLEKIIRQTNETNEVIYDISYNGYYPASIKKGTITNNITFKGPQLLSYGSYKYKYDEKGRRIAKSRDNIIKAEYTYDASNIIRVKYPEESVIIDYHFDQYGSVVGFNYNGNEYFFDRDITSRINKVFDKNGKVLVKYEYTSYGIPTKIICDNLTQSEQLIALDIKQYNIYLYKGYCYDEETQLFWVSSRYYSPELCRWISPDSIEYLDPESINGLNLYAYCGNDPINNYDPTGHFTLPNWAKWVIGGVAFAGAVALTIISGGSLAPVFIGMGVSVASSALIEGAISAYNGEGFWSGFADGAADGAMWGGIFALASSTVSFVKNLGLIKSRGVVIGKGMDRVGFVADQAALSKYSPMKGYNLIRGSGKSTWRVNLADKLSIAHNKAWINRVMRLKKPIYDIGLGGIREAGAWYGMELLEVANYFNYFLF